MDQGSFLIGHRTFLGRGPTCKEEHIDAEEADSCAVSSVERYNGCDKTSRSCRNIIAPLPQVSQANRGRNDPARLLCQSLIIFVGKWYEYEHTRWQVASHFIQKHALRSDQIN